MRIWRIVVLSIVIGFVALWQSQGSLGECRFPVSYTTGDQMNDIFIHQEPGWEFIDITPAYEHGFQVGWIVFVETFDENDPRMETRDQKGLVQILKGGEWVWMKEFEKNLCETRART